MTIGVALEHSRGIILGTDSLFTFGEAPYQKHGTKIAHIGYNIGLLSAGSVDFFKEIYRRLEAYSQLDQLSVPSAAKLVAEQMAEFYLTLTQRFGKRSIEETIHLAPVDMLVAGIGTDNRPYIFHVRPPGIEGPVDDFEVIGSGIFYAGSAIQKRYNSKMTAEQTGTLTVRAIHEASQMDPHVGGDIILASIEYNPEHPENPPFHSQWGQSHLEQYMDIIRAEDAAIRALYGDDTEGSDTTRKLLREIRSNVSGLRFQLRQDRQPE